MKRRNKEKYWFPSIGQTLAGTILTAWLTLPSAEAAETPLPQGTPYQQIEQLVEQGETERALEIIIQQENQARQAETPYKLPDHIQLYAIISRVNNISAWDAWRQNDSYKRQVKDVTKRFQNIIDNFQEHPIETVYLLKRDAARVNPRTKEEFLSRMTRASEQNQAADAALFLYFIIENNHKEAHKKLPAALNYIPSSQRDKHINGFFKLAEYAYKQAKEHEAYTEHAKQYDKTAISILSEAAQNYKDDFELFFDALTTLDNTYTKEKFTAPPIKITQEQYEKALKELQ